MNYTCDFNQFNLTGVANRVSLELFGLPFADSAVLNFSDKNSARAYYTSPFWSVLLSIYSHINMVIGRDRRGGQ